MMKSREIIKESKQFKNDEEKMAKIISSQKADFTQLNTFLPIKCKKKYSIVILSNILEFMKEDQQMTTTSNLNSLLKNNSVVICSNVRCDKPEERELFEKKGFLYQNGANDIISTRKKLNYRQFLIHIKKFRNYRVLTTKILKFI